MKATDQLKEEIFKHLEEEARLAGIKAAFAHAERDNPAKTDTTGNMPTEGDIEQKTLRIPVELWKHKNDTFVRDAMREKSFCDAAIAHVLFNWCGVKNKTRLGRLLGKPDQVDATYRRQASRLLKEASSLSIEQG